ncbi:MAG: hypothetical protein GEU88_18380 [Solirubrobacterales bacterium]|nr:hypothetical protein [Solirubrobacterales bacterium]
MASDEFRVEVDLHGALHGLGERLRSLDLDDEVSERLGDRVIVTRDGDKLYVYTQTAEAATEAERVVRVVLADDGLEAEVRRRRWNPGERFWQDADEPLAASDEPEPPEDAERAAREGLPHPLFVYIEGHQPEFLRDLGI